MWILPFNENEGFQKTHDRNWDIICNQSKKMHPKIIMFHSIFFIWVLYMERCACGNVHDLVMSVWVLKNISLLLGIQCKISHFKTSFLNVEVHNTLFLLGEKRLQFDVTWYVKVHLLLKWLCLVFCTKWQIVSNFLRPTEKHTILAGLHYKDESFFCSFFSKSAKN